MGLNFNLKKYKTMFFILNTYSLSFENIIKKKFM